MLNQHSLRDKNHKYSEKSKCPNVTHNLNQVSVGDLVYVYSDKQKSCARDRYLVVSMDGDWCFIKKFIGNQLRATSYKVKRSECYRVESDIHSNHYLGLDDIDSESEDIESVTRVPEMVQVPPSTLTTPLMNDNTVHMEHPEPQVLIGEIDDSPPVDDPHSDIPDEIPQAMPQRSRKPPTYLEDYVT